MGINTFDISFGFPIAGRMSVRQRMVRFLSLVFTPGEKRDGREEMFAAIMKEHGNIISGICFAYSSNAEEMKDLRQDILLNIWKGLANFRGEAALSTWLYRVALNTCVSTIRKRKGDPATICFDLVGDIPEESDDTSERLMQLHSLIATLSPVDRGIITMWLDERTYDEIAEVTGISRNNVAVRINRIKKRLATGFSLNR
ncbi:MAG: sigma-70 family RNA polymerase sigma factor [Muribaculaceae bacterium]|nr:sigma-70 family RNA polymerase sigma factor [Muribaculaceae bacterium]